MQVTVSVRRYNPDNKENPSYWQEYNLDVDETSSVLDSLVKIREEVDGTLALRSFLVSVFLNVCVSPSKLCVSVSQCLCVSLHV